MSLHWKGAPEPERKVLEGAYTRLEPISPEKHAKALYEAVTAPGVEARFKWLHDYPPKSYEEFYAWVEDASKMTDRIYFAVVDKQTGLAGGRQCFMRVDAKNGVVEMGGVMWGAPIQRTRVSTEAFYLFADYIFSIGYRRLEWKCNNGNTPSKKAAARFGFTYEGLFRQHQVQKGLNRDSAWFSIIDGEWPELKQRFVKWLDPANFDDEGHQLSRLS